MSFEPEELRDSARQVVNGAGMPADEQEIWSLLIELGWLLVPVPEELDGLDMGLHGACVLHSELGRGLAGAPFLPAVLAIDALCQAAPGDRDEWLEKLTGGELVTTSLAEPEVELAGKGDGAVLSGFVPAVQSADRAGHVLLWTADENAVVLAPLDRDGVEVVERPTWDVTRRLFDVRFSGVELEAGQVLSEGPNAAPLVRRLLIQRDFALAADAIGGANALLEMTVEHLQTRRQFGRPLALFQALKHRCADLKAGIVAAEARLSDALARVGTAFDAAEADSEGRAVKLLACAAFYDTAEEALQLHGGIGMASEHPCHLFLKRALLQRSLGRGGDRYEQGLAEAFLAEA